MMTSTMLLDLLHDKSCPLSGAKTLDKYLNPTFRCFLGFFFCSLNQNIKLLHGGLKKDKIGSHKFIYTKWELLISIFQLETVTHRPSNSQVDKRGSSTHFTVVQEKE